jgi:hypothetical protein
MKPSLSCEGQVAHMVGCGLAVEAACAEFLAATSYYRFSGYARYFHSLPREARGRASRHHPPGQDARLSLLLTMGSPDAVDCVVTWTNATGQVRETRVTVRT